MKECQVRGIIGSCCKKSDKECFLKTQAQLPSEEEMLHQLLERFEHIKGCPCQNQAIENIQMRIAEKKKF